ncbi:MAG: DUF3365 domain-containing protein [Saprospiraceae bacterium]|nr:DUF3365 domain-containing protein [Saprospiraceae bacterium]
MKTKLLLSIFTILLLLITACNKKPTSTADQSTTNNTVFIEKGLEIAGATQATMSAQLKQAMETGGVPNAVQYCNVAAYPIADSLSKIHHATIRRVTDKSRNPANAMNEREQLIFKQFKEKWNAEQPATPIVEQLENGEIAFYAPITLQSLCTNCHGKLGETLQPENYAVIQNLYPQDKAIDYVEGDLRGMWSIVMKK